MSVPYKLTEEDQGYTFTTDKGFEYTVVFTSGEILDRDGNTHTIYNFIFDKEGKHDSEKFKNRVDKRVKDTIIHILKEFFKKHGDKALVYFCYDGDESARQRSILFKTWYRDSDSQDILHLQKKIEIEQTTHYGGMLYSNENPLANLLIEAADQYFEELASYK